MGCIMQHLCLLAMFRIYQVKLYHQLTTVTNTQTQSIFAFIEVFQSHPSLFVIFEGSGPSFCRTKHIRVWKPANKHDKVHVFQSLSSGNKVCHVNILHVKTGQVHRPSRFPLALTSFLPDNGSFYAWRFNTVNIQSILGKLTAEWRCKLVFQSMILIVFISFKGQLIATLTTI